MPITGLTDKPNPSRGLVKIGTLYKGGPKPSVNKPGPELDYFRVEFIDKSEEQKALAENILRPAFSKLYGAQPKTIHGVYLVDPQVDLAFQTWKQQYGKSGLVIKCNGQEQLIHRIEDGSLSRDPIPCAMLHDGGKCGCVQQGELRFILPALIKLTGVFGYFTITTHSFNDILAMHGFLSAIFATCGSFERVPFILSRVPREFQRSINGKPSKVLKHMVQIAVEPIFAREQMADLLVGSTVAQLNSGDEIDADTGEYIDEQPAADEHWSHDVSKIESLKQTLKLKGWDLSKLPGKLTDYPTGKAAAQAIQQVYESEREEQKPDPESLEGLRVIDIGRLLDEFNMTESGAMELLGIEDWKELGTYSAARTAILDLAHEGQSHIVVREVQVNTLKRGMLHFDTSLGTMVWYKGAKAMLEALQNAGITNAEKDDQWSKLPDWDGKVTMPEPLLISWSQHINGQYEVDSFELLEA